MGEDGKGFFDEPSLRVLTEAETRLAAYSRPGSPKPMLRMLRAYSPTMTLSFDEAFAEFLSDIRVVLAAQARFDAHTKAVGQFLSELYAIMVDPCAEGTITIAEMKSQLLAAADLQREMLQHAVERRGE